MAVFFLLIPSLRRPQNLIAWNRLSDPGLFPFLREKALGTRLHTNLRTRFVPHIHLLFKFIFCLKKGFFYHMHVIKSVESITHSHPIR